MRKTMILPGISGFLADGGAGAAMMKPAVPGMTDDMRIDLAAHLASLNP